MVETGIETTKWEASVKDFYSYLARPDMNSRIRELLNSNKTRLPLNLDHLRQHYPNLVPTLFSQPTRCLEILERGLQTAIDDLNHEGSSKKNQHGNAMLKRPHYTFSFEGTFGKNHVTPRGLNANTIHNLVAVNGIVTRMSIVRPKLLQSVHYCEQTKTGYVKEYYDQCNLVADKKLQKESNAFPKKDKDNNPYVTEYGFCKYRDHQVLLVQEMPEKAPTGMMPHSVEVILEEDLVDKVKPGDRIQVTGVYKALVGHNTAMNAMFKGVLVATNIHVLSTDEDTPFVSPDDIRQIRKLAERKDVFEILSKSVAPSIFGHDFVKKAILLMLLGGVEKNLESKTHLRGDINVLMIGDPSTAKSQLLRRVLSIAPLAINTTGRGSSGVGLTAAVTFDKDTGEKHLEAGAMVLADRGIVCIDEFDKMEEADRVAIHEVMEQQTVTIAKAGIHTTLNARCSVVAAANPIYGEYQKDLPPTKNIGLPDSLLSRFDFIFIVLDEKNSQLDRMIAERVTRNHRYIAPGQEDNFMLEQNDEFYIEPELIDRNDNEVFEKYNAIIHDMEQGELLTQRFLKKYIFFAKKTVTPTLKEDAVNFISNAWTELRQREKEETNTHGPKTMTITIRTLETLIRVATAHAKMRLSKDVEVFDCEKALELMNFALFNERKDDNDSEDGGDREETITMNKEVNDRASRKERRDKKKNEREMEEEIIKQESETTSKKTKKTKEQEAKQDKQLNELTKKVKVMDIGKKDEDAEDILERIIPSEIEVTQSAINFVFKEIQRVLNGRTQFPEAELWNEVKETVKKEDDEVKRCLQKREGLRRVLTKLDDQNVIMYDAEKKLIISM